MKLPSMISSICMERRHRTQNIFWTLGAKITYFNENVIFTTDRKSYYPLKHAEQYIGSDCPLECSCTRPI